MFQITEKSTSISTDKKTGDGWVIGKQEEQMDVVANMLLLVPLTLP